MAAAVEIHSFVGKFLYLLQAGLDATLNIDSNAGQASVSLRVVGLGAATPPYQHLHPQPPHFPQRAPGPSRIRRKQRREEARSAAAENVARSNNDTEVADDDTAGQVVDENESDNLGHEAALAVEASDDPQVMAISKEAEEASKHLAIRETATNEADQARSEYSCEMCDFVSNWKNGLRIHVSRKHGNIEQLDGHNDDSSSDDKYFYTRNYWEKGRLGTVYQSYLDAKEIIEKSDIKEDEKFIENEKLLDSRKLAFGQDFKRFPPWNGR